MDITYFKKKLKKKLETEYRDMYIRATSTASYSSFLTFNINYWLINLRYLGKSICF